MPVEWDDFRKQLEKLTESLQPTSPGGVNSLGEFINSTADNLRGEGDTAHDTIIKLSQAISALGDHADDIFSTVRNLQLLVSALYSSSDLLASFNKNLASVTTVLSNTPNEVANAVQSLDGALADLRGFLAENRESIGVTFDRLSSVTTALNDSRADIKQILHVVPTVFQNFMNIYQPAQGAMTGIIALNNFADIPQWICSSIESASQARLGSSLEAMPAVRRADHQEPHLQLRTGRAQPVCRAAGPARVRSPTARTGFGPATRRRPPRSRFHRRAPTAR